MNGYKNRMIPCITVLFACALPFLGAAWMASSASDMDPLWQKAMEIASMNDKWVPGYVIHNEAVYSKLGIRFENTETHSVLRKLQDGKVELTFLKVVQNGRDITRQFKKEIGEKMILEEEEYRVEHPFRGSSPSNVQYRRMNKKRIINRKSCILYEFTYKNEQGTWQGTAWLEEKTGAPLLVQGTLVTVPLKEEWYTISGLETTISFTSNNGDWYPESTIIDSLIEIGEDPSELYKSRVKETYEFKDHWKYK